jgi:3-phytase
MACKKKALTLCLLLFLCGCEKKEIIPKATTSPSFGKADECDIWIHPHDPQKSALITNDKSSSGSLTVWDLDGNLLCTTTPLDEPVGVSIRRNLVACGLRSTNEIKIFAIDPDSRHLTDVTSDQKISTGFPDKTYGFCLYERETDNALFAFVSRKATDHIHQIYLEDDGTGKIKGTLVRKFGKEDQQDVVEGMIADDEQGTLYCADEQHALLKYRIDPDENRLIQIFGVQDGIEGDREGLALYKKPDGKGFLVLSSQGNSTFKIYRREDKNEFVKSVHLPGVTKTDGIAASSTSIPPKYPNGIFVAHDDRGNNYVLYDWDDFL